MEGAHGRALGARGRGRTPRSGRGPRGPGPHGRATARGASMRASGARRTRKDRVLELAHDLRADVEAVTTDPLGGRAAHLTITVTAPAGQIWAAGRRVTIVEQGETPTP